MKITSAYVTSHRAVAASATPTPPTTHHHAHRACAACDQAHAGARAAAHPKQGTSQQVKMKMYMGKRDGKMHALTSNANFTVTAGKPVTLTITNADDDMTHSFTVPDLGIDLKLPPAKDGKPTVRTVTFTPKKAGEIKWHCNVPCDPEAMSTDGMMRGAITVKPSGK